MTRYLTASERILWYATQGKSMMLHAQSPLVRHLYEMEHEGLITVKVFHETNTYTPILTELGKMLVNLKDL